MGGMEDVGHMSRQAADISEAAYVFRDALKRASVPYRGIGIDCVAVVNKILEPEGYRLQVLVDPGRAPQWR